MIHRSHLRRRFSLRLLEAMGLGSIAAGALAGVACGGNVNVDGGGAQGTSSVTTGAGGAGSCTPQIGPGQMLAQVCVPAEGEGCPPSGGIGTPLQDQIAASLGLCSAHFPGDCCNESAVTSVPCGPDPSSDSGCCYYAIVEIPGCVLGRPFTAGGAARIAAVQERRDWTAPAAPAVSDLDAPTRRALAEAWTRDARYEHASIASFARLALELLAVGAPAELVRDAQQAMGDEIRHAERSFALAGAYAGAPVGPGPLPFEGAFARTSLVEVAAAAVREGCVGETVAALAAAEARDAAVDPAVRAALGAIAADEAEHAAMAWRLAAWAFRSGGAEVRAAIAEAFAAPVDAGGEADPEGIDAAAFRAHGRLLPSEQRSHAERALAEVVRPSAAALLASAA